ncbi:unnamed protein product [Durusdinium trenchii]|uniref:ubiquitinyl hydrolase 1 n=1 Tax=Durusdinium trenchii TaxID=1381693 RepID=A0ABP0JN68_9DINO
MAEEFHLHQVFPALLKHADAKLSANGQDLGGEVLSSSRLGFSGTPNDLLPRSLGQCRYAQGDDAKMLTTLSDPLVVQVSLVEEGWNAQRLLQRVATHQPPLNALIDVGALITGLSNEQVARALLDYGLPFEAVVFCDSGGGQQLLRRTSATAVKVSNCTLPLHRRFVFYDQVHTTGIDIRHPAHACAALTLGKDSTFRDFAQGAYRLRGIKKGQRLQVLVTPEVAARIEEEVPMAKRDSDLDAASPPQVSMLDKVCAWLLVRQVSAEQTQRRLLSRQAVQYQGRRYAYETLMKKIRAGEAGTLQKI